MFSKWQFWLITVVVALAGTIAYAVTRNELILWIAGLILFFWVNGRIREEISDNYYINAAYTTLTACVLTVPQIFFGGTIGGWVLYALTMGYQTLAYFSNYEYITDHTIGRDLRRNWSSKTKTDVQKAYGHYVLTEGNRAALILTGIAFLIGAFAIAGVSHMYSLFFLLLIPVYTFLWNMIALFQIWLLGVPIPTGFDWHEHVNNIPKGSWFLIWSVLKAIFGIISAPFIFIASIFIRIAKFFGRVKNGGTAELSKFFWICTGVLGVYFILSIFGAADFVEEIFGGGFGGIDLEISRYVFPITNFILKIDWDTSFLVDVILFIPKLIVLLLCAILDLVIIILVPLLWLLINFLLFILYLILVVSFELILPIALVIGAVTFIVLYMVDSDRDFIDWFRAILFSLLPVAMITFYLLFAYGVLTLF